MEIINMTPHEVNLVSSNGEVFQLFESQGIARAVQSRVEVGSIVVLGNVVAINSNTFGELTGLPDEQEGVFYIVSALAAKAAPSRKDLLLVDDTVRDESNRIVGCRAFALPD